jgi:hypothetical protein
MQFVSHTLFALSAVGCGAAMALALGAEAAEAPAPPATPVAPVTVSPAPPRTGRVVATSEETPALAAPGFKASEARVPPMAVKIAPNAAFGRQTLDNTRPSGLLGTNPDLGAGAQTVDVGVTALF